MQIASTGFSDSRRPDNSQIAHVVAPSRQELEELDCYRECNADDADDSAALYLEPPPAKKRRTEDEDLIQQVSGELRRLVRERDEWKDRARELKWHLCLLLEAIREVLETPLKRANDFRCVVRECSRSVQ